MKNLITRSITGLFFVFIVVASIFFSSRSFFVLFSFIIISGMWEFYSMTEKKDIQPQKIVAILIGLLMFLAFFLFAKRIVDAYIFVHLYH